MSRFDSYGQRDSPDTTGGDNAFQFIDMTRDKMAIKAISDGKGPFEIYEGTGLNGLQVCSLPCFVKQVELNRCGCLFGSDLDRSKAAAVYGYTIADFQSASAGFRADD